MKKMLLIRFSSFGDIIQARSLLDPLLKSGCVDSVDWLIRKDLLGLLKGERRVQNIIIFDRRHGLRGLIKLALHLRKVGYDYVYDAHNNLRSKIVRFFLCSFSHTTLIIRSKDRWKRFLLFKLRINEFPRPYRAMVSYWKPLALFFCIDEKQYRLSPSPWPLFLNRKLKEVTKGRIILVPSAAWRMKRWPKKYWRELIALLPEHQFTLLGGPEDHFCKEIRNVAPGRVINMAGKLSLEESCTVVGHCDFIVTGDTGLQQVADFSGRAGLSLMGPTAFGFVSMGSMKTIEIADLSCRPCSKDGRGRCSQGTYQKCMVDIFPSLVAREIRSYFSSPSSFPRE